MNARCGVLLQISTIYYIQLGVANPIKSQPNPFLIVRMTLSTTLLCYVNGEPVKYNEIPLSSQNYLIILALKPVSPSPLILLTNTQLMSFFNAANINVAFFSSTINGMTTKYFVLMLIANKQCYLLRVTGLIPKTRSISQDPSFGEKYGRQNLNGNNDRVAAGGQPISLICSLA
ncbi:MAG: hypothetical protein EZS28_042379 [Streblomastix strix]|uniref:Uncharacterized protein n=1 Tax=Streblomastix strix TaxID=222440 RepID=A0A5J4TVZ3_9EUKA|nr:MAG: hypothetical protein EZS28_042379 [Streblomastix strix]